MSFEQSAGMERFDGYEAEIKLVQADLNQKLDQISEMSGEQRKAAIKQAESSLEEAKELVRGHPNRPAHSRLACCLSVER